jgi:hypothetical protein
MSRPVANPYGAWPMEMRAEQAAAYCGEPSVEAFLKKVPKVYSPPAKARGSLPKWHRAKLNRDIAKRHGLRDEGPALSEDVEDLI